MSPFKGDKKELLALISNVEPAVEVINPDNSDFLYKLVLTRVSGEPRVAKTYGILENLEELRASFKTYTEESTQDFHATKLFGVKQDKNESISECIQSIQSYFET